MLASPIEGTLAATVFVGAYFDHGGAAPRDYQCGIKAYSGHRGVDILLRNFAVQDSGVGVIAAAPGTVVTVADGAFDRSTANGAGGFGNHVAIRHADGSRAFYAHLRAGSILVRSGDPVQAGERLGLVGSSGNSNWPHLHFEVARDFPFDPFDGPCGAPRSSLWQDQLSYQDGFQIVDAGLTGRPLVTFSDLLERPAEVDTFRTTDASFLAWLNLANLNAAATEFRLVGPDSNVVARVATGPRWTFSMTFGTWRMPIAGVLTRPGGYWVEFLHQPVQGSSLLLAQRLGFTLVEGPIALRQVPAAYPRNGVAGFSQDARDGPPR